MSAAKRDYVEILWTGGFDSTFRIIQLSKNEIDIQPYYLSDNRACEQYELDAIDAIIADLTQRPDTKATILPLVIVNMSERIENELISLAYSRMRKKDFFGSQYDWLARFATLHQGIELSIHQDDKALLLIKKYGHLREISSNSKGTYYQVDKENSESDIYILFGNYHLPLVHYTKIDMRNFYQQNGYESIMERTWFCHTPINGKPCGCCNPCRYTIQEGLKERFSTSSIIRYYIHEALRTIKNTIHVKRT